MDWDELDKSMKIKPLKSSATEEVLEAEMAERVKKALEPIFSKIAKKIEQTDLTTRKPPFLPNLFYIWRFDAFKEVEKATEGLPFAVRQKFKKAFVQTVDGKLLETFEEKMKQPYFDLVYRENYNMPVKISESDLEENKYLYSELKSLSESIARWCILIEKCSDVIECAILYGLAAQDENSIYYDLLKKDKNYHKHFSLKGYTRSLLNKSVLFSLDSLSKMVFSKGFPNIPISWATGMAILYWLVGGAAFPWGFILGRLQIPWLLGGIIGSKAIQKVSTCLKGYYKQNDLKEIEQIFININIQLDDFYLALTEKISHCFDQADEASLKAKKDAVQQYINSFMLEKFSGDISEDELLKLGIERLDVKEEDGWIIVDPKECEIKEEELDNGFTKIDLV